MMDSLDNAQRAGFDLTLIEASLQLSFEERALEHQRALDVVLELEMIGRRQRESAQQTATDPDRR
jgi:hypothetical protein